VLTADRLPGPGETVLGTTLSRLPGGKGANQAVAAARAGGHVLFVGAVGDDEAGTRSADHLRDAGVDTRELLVLPGTQTGIAVVLVSADGENQIVILAGANGLLNAGHVSDALGRLALTDRDVLLVGFEIGDDAVRAAARCAGDSGARLLVNPAPARPLPDGIEQARPVLVPNASEAELLTGEKDERAAAEALAARTGAPVVVTLGARGALVVDGSSVQVVPSLTVEAVDTTGAGDTLAGVLAASLADGLALTAAVRRAAVAAALSVTAKGAQAGMPLRTRIDEACATAP
jgi:ribokinase